MPELNVFDKIVIKDNSFIGIGSTILLDVTIGPNSVVGAGSVVTKDVPPNTVVAGVPARKVCSIDDYKKKCVSRGKRLALHNPRSKWKNSL